MEDAAWKRSLSHFDPYASVSAWDLGRLSDAASVADDAIFHVLSTARHNCHVKITAAQLGMHEPEPTQPEEGPGLRKRERAQNVGPNGDSRAAGGPRVADTEAVERSRWLTNRVVRARSVPATRLTLTIGGMGSGSRLRRPLAVE